MFELMVHKKRFKEKPVKFDLTTQIFSWYETIETDIPEMAKLVSSGLGWRNAIYDKTQKSFKKKHVIGSRFIVLDFDAVDETAEEMCEITEWEPNFWYHTLSQGVKPGNNFRMVWVFTEAFGPQNFAFMYKWFLKKFPKADKNVKDISRFWYGGNGSYKVLRVKPYKFHLNVAKTEHQEIRPNSVAAVVGPNWEEKLLTDLWGLYKSGKATRPQRLLLIGNLKFIECAEKPVFDEVMKYAKNPEEVLRWYQDDTVCATPIIGGETVAEYFNKLLF